MRQSFHSLRAAMLACALCSASLGAFGQAGDRTVSPAVAHKQKAEIARGDPARWYKADRSEAARMHTLKKEIAAAYSEAKTACDKGPAASRAGCLKQARATRQRDMADAPSLLAAAPAAESFTEKVTTMGSSQAGQAQAGAPAGAVGGQPEMVTEQHPAQPGQMQSGQDRPPQSNPEQQQ